jgi:hypothetical protein
MTGRKDTTLTIRIAADLKERGIEVARADGYSLSTAIEIFITQYIAFAKKHGTDDSALPGTVLGKLLRK